MASSGLPPSLAYATPSRRPRVSRPTLVILLASVMIPPLTGWLLVALPHNLVCPGCGGWGAGGAVTLAGGMLIASGWVLVREILRRATVATIILASLALVVSVLSLLAAIGFYFAIQA